ncbi:hypothetical protein ACFX1Q_024402 [Malus domestica]
MLSVFLYIEEESPIITIVMDVIVPPSSTREFPANSTMHRKVYVVVYGSCSWKVPGGEGVGPLPRCFSSGLLIYVYVLKFRIIIYSMLLPACSYVTKIPE